MVQVPQYLASKFHPRTAKDEHCGSTETTTGVAEQEGGGVGGVNVPQNTDWGSHALSQFEDGYTLLLGVIIYNSYYQNASVDNASFTYHTVLKELSVTNHVS